MTRSVDKSRLLCAALLSTLMITAGFALICDSSPHGAVRTVAAQTSVASANTTVENSVTVNPVSLSLGSALQATGKVTAGGKPLTNALVALHMGDLKLAEATTNANGDYSFNVPIGVNYFPAAFWGGATVYTVVEPQNASLISTPSAVATVSVDLLPLYLIIAVIAGAILVGLYLYTRRMRGKSRAKPAAEEMAKEQASSPVSEASTLKQGHAVAHASLQGEKQQKKQQKNHHRRNRLNPLCLRKVQSPLSMRRRMR